MQAQQTHNAQSLLDEAFEKCGAKRVCAYVGRRAERLSLKVCAKSARRGMCQTKKKQPCATLEKVKC